MKINYNVTGAQRKSLANAISQEVSAPARYLGAPTFAYEVGSYQIDKNGVLEGEDHIELVKKLQSMHGFKAKTEEYDTEAEDRNSTYKADKNYHLYDTFNSTKNEAAYNLVVELPKENLTELGIENLKGLLKSKESLIKKALGIKELPLIEGEETLSFPWFYDELNSDEIKAYSHFISSLCEMAHAQKRVVIKENLAANEKYAFRCFLLRLGFIGSEHKTNRRILLSKLSGSSAFKDGLTANKEVR